MGANRFYSEGHRMDYTPTAAVAAGDIVVVGSMLGYAHSAIAANAKGAVQIDGFIKLAKPSGTLAQGDDVWWDTVAKDVKADSAVGPGPLKVIIAAATGDTEVVCQLNPYNRRDVSYASGAAGTLLENTVTETTFFSTTIPANTLRVGDVLEIVGSQIVDNVNGTPTLTIKTYVGENTAGTAKLVASSANAATAAADVGVQHYFVEVRAIGTNGTLYPVGEHVLDAAGTLSTKVVGAAVTAVDTTKNTIVKQTGTWGTAHADNEVTPQTMFVKLHGKT